MSEGHRRERIPQLDGLRGVAILLVVFAHMWDGVPPINRRLIEDAPFVSGGGLFGVQLFFVLSGFLITSLLLHEYESIGGIRLREFYRRRVRRLVPALAIVAGTYAVYSFLAHTGAQRTEAFGSIARAITYTENLQSVLGWPTDRALGHTWSLAVEEQFYLLWPALLLIAVSRWGRVGVGRVAIGLIVLTLLSRPVFRLAGVPVGFGMHWNALMIGSLLAVRPVTVPKWLGRLGFAVLFASLLFLPENDMLAYSIAVAAGTLALSHACTTEWLKNRVLCFFGTISYGLYLWHAFLLWFGWPVLPTVAVSIAVATLSFYGVERRFLRRSSRTRDAENVGARSPFRLLAPACPAIATTPAPAPEPPAPGDVRSLR